VDKTVLLGLSKLLEKQAKLARPDVEAGEHDLDATVTLHVSGTLSVGDDTMATPSHKIPWKVAFALFLQHAGITRERAMDGLVYAMQAALELDEDAAELVQSLADLEAAEELVQAGLDELPKEPRKGAVSAKALDVVEVRPSRSRAA
jgi:hypothetical protein